ncbi:MAG: hypothetical protein OQK23_05780, partial [Rhodospirillales bacterium]|nr:hypothetical protein [Rhodospirillales bacterium]
PPPVTGQQAAPSPGAVLTGQIVGTTSQGQTLIQTPIGLLALAGRPPITSGTNQIILETVPQPARTQPPPGPMAAQTGASAMLREWPTLVETLGVVQQSSPAVAEHIINNAIPKPGGMMTANILFFISALRGGDVKGWLGGPAARILDRVKPGLLQKLGDEFNMHSATITDSTHGDWRAYLLPVHTGAAIEQIRLYLRRKKKGGKKGGSDDKAGTRFIFDLELSAFGRMQLDGLAKETDHHLNLIIRTETPLDEEVSRGISGVFIQACEGMGLTGQLTFQETSDFVEIDGMEIESSHTMGVIV